MSDNVSGLPRRGQTYFGGTVPTTVGQSASVEGFQKTFNDVDPSASTSGPKTRRSNRKVECMLVRNGSGITLAAKRLVTWKAAYRGKRVGGYARLDFTEAAGVVDDHIGSGGVADGDLFWLVRKGPCLCRTPLEANALNVMNEGDVLVALTAVTSQATTAGRVAAWAVTSDVTSTFQAAINRVGRAMSAKTTANTNADVLVDLEIMSVA
jgi:hypothetical protein